MKSKVLICALAVLLVIGMVSCSMDEYAKLGDFMGKMGNNVYGIEPSMKEVNSATANINGAVKKDEAGNVTDIGTDGVGKIIEDLVKIKENEKKIGAMKEELSKPVSEDETESKAVKAKMSEKIGIVVDDAKNITIPEDANPAVKDVYKSVTDALDKIQSKIESTDSPTKADLATVTIVASLAETVTDIAKRDDVSTEELLKEANKAYQAIDALKIAADAAGLGDLLGDSISSLISSANSSSAPRSIGKSATKAGTESQSEVMARLLVPTAEKLVTLVCNDDGSVNEKKYNRVLLQLSAIRVAYETSASFVMPKKVVYSNDFSYVDTVFGNGNIGFGKFSLNDAVLYTIAFAFTEADGLFKDAGEDFSKFLDSFLKAYASEKEDDIKKVEEQLEKFLDCFKVDGMAERASIGVNTLCLILSDCDWFDIAKDAAGRDSSLGGYINGLFNN